MAAYFTPSAQAQTSSGGKMMVAENGALFIVGKHNFAKGSGLITPGIIETSRTGAKGYVNFGKGSSWSGATEGRFVNGYVRVTHEHPFVFPIGDTDNYRPVASSGAINTTAAYFSERLSRAFTNKENGLGQVSDREYWDIGGDTPVTLSFTWGSESNVANMTAGQIDKLTLVGWRNNQWEVISSKIIPSKIIASNHVPSELGGSELTLSTDILLTEEYSEGVISTSAVIVPNEYTYFTLGVLGETTKEFSSQSRLVSLYPNPVVKDVYVNLRELGTDKGQITIYDMHGKEMTSRAINKQSTDIQHFDTSNYVNGLYKLHINIGDEQVVKQFLVGNTY